MYSIQMTYNLNCDIALVNYKVQKMKKQMFLFELY